jgi:hypothetical protein
VVINDLDFQRLPFSPNKADEVLIVDSYAVLPFSVRSQRFQPVSRRAVQVFKKRSGVKHYEFSVRRPLNDLGYLAGMLPFENFLRFFALEARYHTYMI